MIRDIDRVLIDRDTIARRVHELGEQIAADLLADLRAEGSPDDAAGRIVLIPILTGSIVFVADLIRQLPMKLSIGVMGVSSYPGKTIESKGAMLRSELPDDLTGKHILVVDDILDSGRTLALVRDIIGKQHPASLRVCVLLSKQIDRAVKVDADYVGFEIPNEFVVGYGLDYDGYYRNYPQIGVLKQDAR